MDYSIKKEALCTCETIFDGIVEQPVDLDFSLPDYCPDIQKILKCQISPQVSAQNISGDKLFVEGNANISLVYLDEEKMSVRCCEHTSPFSVSINLKTSVQNAVVCTKTKTEYVNCRAVTPRRLDIHGAFSIFVKVKSKKERDFVCDIEGDGVEKKKIAAKSNNVLGLGQQYFNIAEVIDKGSKQPEIGQILRTYVTTELQDYKTLQNKVMINAVAKIKVVYVGDMEYGNIEILEHSIPISQIVDVEGVKDDCDCDVNIEVLNHEIGIKSSDSDENNLLAFECKIGVAAVAYEDKDINILSDVYSVDYESEPKYEKISVSRLKNKLNKPYMLKSSIDIDNDEISELIDSVGELNNVKCFVNDKNINFEGKINVCILAKDSDEIPFFLERLVEFSYEHELEDDSEFILCEENIVLKSCECRLIGKNSVEVSAELQIGALIYEECKYLSITDIFVDEEKLKEKDKNTAVTIYYTDEGEELWNIAKKYCTSVEKIKTENDLDDEKVHGRNMLFIPM